MTDVFSRIYRTNEWNGTESRSGPGSGSSATARVAAELVALVAELGVTSVLDIGCGDGYWMPDLPHYVGLDASSEAIRLARLRHPARHYEVADMAGYDAGRYIGFDLVLVRDVIQHLSLIDGLEMLKVLRGRRGSCWLLASTFRGGANVDIATGDAYSPDLTVPPFDMDEPERVIFDGWGYTDGNLVRDPRKYLGLWRL